jgi:hypothetical protein
MCAVGNLRAASRFGGKEALENTMDLPDEDTQLVYYMLEVMPSD